jgi:hypothetical protein
MKTLVRGRALVCMIVLSGVLNSACTTQTPAARTPPRCQRWDVGGTWSINQSNGFFITFIVRQNQDEVVGTADSGSGTVPLVGTLHDNQLAMTVSWTRGGAGRYTATMSPAGLLIDGFTQNVSMPSSTATWSTAQQFKCQLRAR